MKAQIEFTGTYVHMRTGRTLYNYVVIGGDVDQYSKDQEELGFLSLQDSLPTNGIIPKPEHIGLPRYVSLTSIGNTNTIIRIPRKDGSMYWGPE